MKDKNWENSVKRYYIETEKYDWVDVTDHLRGIESIFHLNRMRVMEKLVSQYEGEYPAIEIGCGTGLVLRKLPPNTIGLDINPWALSKARVHVPNADLIIADAENLPFQPSVFRNIVCTETLEHLPYPENAIAEIHRVLKNNGKFIGSVPNDTIFWKFRVLSSTCPHSEPFHNKYRLEEVKRLLNMFRLDYIKISTLRLAIVFVTTKIIPIDSH